MKRIIAKLILKKLRGKILTQARQRDENRQLWGELMTIDMGGRQIRARHFAAKQKNAPVYFDIHGGGFTWGTIEDGDTYCHRLNEQLDFEVYALDYPLVPEVEYPVALHNLYDTINYMRKNSQTYNINPDCMVIGGRSAGANLSAALCLLAKERGEFQFVCQVLDHGAFDFCGIIPDSERYTGVEALPISLLKILGWAYVKDKDRNSIFCSPLAAKKEELIGLPPAVVQTCERDSVRPDGDYYAKKLTDAGVRVRAHCYPEVPHGFTEVEGPEEMAGQQWLIDGIVWAMNG